MKEEQNYHQKSEQLDFLYETTKKGANKKNEDIEVKSSLNSDKEQDVIMSEKNVPVNILIIDTETTGLDNKNDDCLK